MNECESGHCVTCSDEALQMQVLEVGAEGNAICDGGEVLTELVGPVSAGDTLLVHAGVAIARVE